MQEDESIMHEKMRFIINKSRYPGRRTNWM